MLKNVIIIYNKGGVKFLQKVFFSFDDSGILHIKEKSGYFVYAGYVFTSLEEKEKKINKRKTEFDRCAELLAQFLPTDDKEKEKAHLGKEEEKSPEAEAYLNSVQNDPYYFYE